MTRDLNVVDVRNLDPRRKSLYSYEWMKSFILLSFILLSFILLSYATFMNENSRQQ